MILTNHTKYRFIFTISMLWFVWGNVSGQCNFANGPVGELCTSAIYICGSDLDGYTGRLQKELSAPQIWSGLCNGNGTADNIVWFSFTPCSKKVCFKITPSFCTVENNSYSGLQAGLFASCNRNASVACTDDSSNNGQTAPFTLCYNDFQPGEIAYLFIDGYAGSVCDFEIEVVEGIDTTPVATPDPSNLSKGAITGPPSIPCDQINTPLQYNLLAPECKFSANTSCAAPQNINPADSICYVWKVDPSTGAMFNNQDSVGRTVELIFTQPGTYTITADIFFHPFYGGSCANASCGDIISWKVTVLPPDTIVNPLIFICPGNFADFCGNRISTDSTVYCASDPCKVVRQDFKVGTSKFNDLGIQNICQGSSFTFQGELYELPGTYNIVDKTDCALVHHFEIKAINLSVNINPASTLLDCNNTSIQLTGTGVTNATSNIIYKWADASGNIVSNTNALTVSKAGRFTLSGSYNATSETCYDEAFIDISSDFKKPKVTAIIPTVKCLSIKDAKPVLTLVTLDNLTFTEWTLPLGSKRNTLNLELDSLNAASSMPYLFTAIGANGCRLDTSFVVNTNFEKAFITLTGEDLTCYHPKDTLILSTNIPVDSVRWLKTFPTFGFYGSDPAKRSHAIESAGTYKVEVMASASRCWSDETITIQDKMIYPDLMLEQGLKWHCNTKAVEITPLTNLDKNLDYQWASDDGKISSDSKDKKVIVEAPGTYTIQITDVSNGCIKKGQLTIPEEQNKPSEIVFSAVDVLCHGESNGVLEIFKTVGGFGPFNYTLNGMAIQSLLEEDLSVGKYNLEVKDQFDCTYKVEFEISEPERVEVRTPVELSIAFNESTDLTFVSNYPNSEIAEVLWTNSKGDVLGNDLSLSYSSDFSDIIYVDITTLNGCAARSEIKINVDTELKLYFPNIFSPNNDGVNDRLEIFKNKIPANMNKIVIFDRYGNKVYEAKDFAFETNTDGWDGTFNGKEAETGVYILIIELTDFSGKNQIIKKDLTLVR